MNQVAQTVPVCTFFVEELKHQGPEKAGVWPYRREQGGCRSGSVPALAVGSAGLAPVIPASGPTDSRHWSQGFQLLAPVIPATGSNAEHIAKPCCPGCRTSRKMYLRKGKTLSRREEQVKNKCKKEIYEHQGQKEGGEGLLPELEQRFSCSFSNRVQQSKCFPVATGEEHVWSDVHTADQENPPKSAGYSLREPQGFSWQEQQPMGLTAAPVPNLLQSSASGVEGQGRREGVKLSLGKRGGGLWGRWFSVCFSLSNSILTCKNDSGIFHRQDSLASDGKW